MNYELAHNHIMEEGLTVLLTSLKKHELKIWLCMGAALGIEVHNMICFILNAESVIGMPLECKRYFKNGKHLWVLH